MAENAVLYVQVRLDSHNDPLQPKSQLFNLQLSMYLYNVNNTDTIFPYAVCKQWHLQTHNSKEDL